MHETTWGDIEAAINNRSEKQEQEVSEMEKLPDCPMPDDIYFWEVSDSSYDIHEYYLTIEDVLHDYPKMKKISDDEYKDTETYWATPLYAFKTYPKHFRK